MDNIQQRIYTLESMARQGEATHKDMQELFKLQTKLASFQSEDLINQDAINKLSNKDLKRVSDILDKIK
jgi:hypothetical protein